MNYLLLLLIFPLIWPFIAKGIFGRELVWSEVGANIGICVFAILIVWFSGTFSKTVDVQILNGEITGKQRDHGTYIESYPCNCRTNSEGHTSCDTCYRTHYTVDWYATSTVGRIQFAYEDSTSMAVYAYPDPTAYKICKTGESASVESTFINYVKAVPESLFNKSIFNSSIKTPVPSYPRVYDFYRINRVLSVGSAISREYIDRLNFILNEELEKLGPKKEANVIVILTNSQDPAYRYKVEKEWIGSKKNDTVVFIGLDQTKIVWADVMTFGLNKGNEMYRVFLRDKILALGSLQDPNQLKQVIVDQVGSGFKRTHMEEFDYLKTQIQPPTWAIVLCLLLSFGGSIGLSIYLARNYTREY